MIISVDRIHTTIEALVQLARPQGDMQKLMFYLHEVEGEVKNQCMSLAARSEIDLRWSIQEDARIDGHFPAACQIVIALVSNAIDAARQAANESTENLQPLVCVKGEYVDHQAILTVEDNGIGVPAAVAQKIYDPFCTTKPAGKGQGLGLSISSRFSSIMDAELDHYATADGKTCFRVRFAKNRKSSIPERKTA